MYGQSQSGFRFGGQPQLPAPFQGGGGSNLGSNLGSIFPALSQIGMGFGQLNQTNPADPAMSYLGQIPGQTKGYYEPYIQAGQQAIPQLQQQYQGLLNDPSKLLKGFGQNFQQSPGYNFQLQQALGAAGNAASAGGMAGSPAHQQEAMRVASGLANQDYYNYLNNVLGLYGQGLSGTQGLYGGGLQAGGNYADLLASQLATQAQLAYAGQANQNQQQAAGTGNILGGIGGFLGGPIGQAAGNWLGNLF